MQLEYLSASRINTYLQCPLKYHATYDLKMRDEPHPAALMGSAVHKMFEASSAARFRDRYKTLHDPLRFLDSTCKRYRVDGSNYPLMRKMVANAIDWGYFRGVQKSFGFEVHFFESLPDGTKVKGFIDRLDLGEVIDIKTGKRPLTDEDLESNWQARVYNWAVRSAFDFRGDLEVAFWFLRHRVQRVVKTQDDADRDAVEMMKLATEIRECESPKAFESGLCPYCPYSKECPTYNGKVSIKEQFFELRKDWD